jgi:GNAT superfamily N-acetyltransferase
MPIPSPIAVRRATPDDASDIAEIGVEGWRAAYAGLMPAEFLAGLNVAAREVAWRVRLEAGDDDRAPSWLAVAGDRVVGFVVGGPPRDDDLAADPSAAEIYGLYVRPAEWRRGAGRVLLNTAVEEWRRRGTVTLALWVLEANLAGRAFYAAMEIGRAHV